MALAKDIQDEWAALLKNGIAGNQACYGRFLKAITPLLRNIVSRKIVTADAEDVLQEILISVHKARHTYDGNRPLLPWLAAIAQYRIADHLRRVYAMRDTITVEINELAILLADVTVEAPGNEPVERMLETLSERDRKILMLMHVEGYTAKEAGQRLDMNESAVKVAAHRALKKVRETFGT